MKKIVIFGGGSGLSQLLKGLKLFPMDLTAVVSMSDNGRSTGMLRKDFNIPAVGDITKVMLSMSDADKDTIDLLNYRFHASSSIESHSIKNLMLTALLDMKGLCLVYVAAGNQLYIFRMKHGIKMHDGYSSTSNYCNFQFFLHIISRLLRCISTCT